VTLLSAGAAAVALALLFVLRSAKRRGKRASPCRQCTAQRPPGWPSDLCVTCLRVRDELQLLETGWRGTSSLQWLVRRQGAELGPYSLAALRVLAEHGKLAAYDRVWTEGMGSWRRADLIEGLLPARERPSAAGRSNFFLAHWRGAFLTAAMLIATAAGLRLVGARLPEHPPLQVAPTPGLAPTAPPAAHTVELRGVDHGTTAVADENQHARNGIDAGRAELEADFVGVPVFAVLQRLEPATFTYLRDTYVSGVLGGAPQNEMSARVRMAMMEKVIPKYVRVAPDHELVAYWRTQIEKAQELRAIDPRYCAEFLAPTPGSDTRELVGLFSAKAQQADIRALADLMVAGSKDPQKVPQETTVQGALQESVQRAEQRMPGALQIVAHPGMATVRPSEFCHAEVAFYESILALPTERAGPLLRYLVAQG
jgi:GYF domain 2